MKTIFIIIFQTILMCLNIQSQTHEKPEIADPLSRAINEFNMPLDSQNFSLIIDLLENLKDIYSDSTEIRYFLGYAYDRFNSKDGRSIPNINRNITLLSSEQFEYIITKEVRYSGRKLALDPYSKLTSIWGSLAMKYYFHEELDSMKHALIEGKNRGGFNDVLLEFGENILKSCKKNSILFVSGDNFSFPILFVQQIKGIRKDIQIIDISLLNTDWYCSTIQRYSTIDFLRDSINYNSFPPYAESKEQIVNILCYNFTKNFEWEINNLRNDKYFIKSDSILKEIVIKNRFKHDIYFTVGQFKEDLLSLENHFSKGVLVDKINACKNNLEINIEDQIRLLSFESILNDFTKNSDDLLQLINRYRFAFLNLIYEKIENNSIDEAISVLAFMEKKLPYEYAPIQNEYLENYINDLKKKVSR